MARTAGRSAEETRRLILDAAQRLLARSGTAVDTQPYLRVLAEFRSRSWTVDELVLVRSHLPGAGAPGERPRYEVVARGPLGAAG